MQPTTIPPYRMSLAVLKELNKQLNNLLDKDFIQLSIYLWGATFLFFRKKNGSLRMCIDYQQLKKVIFKSKYPLAKIDCFLDQLERVIYFSTIDL